MPSTTATIKHRTQITGTNTAGIQVSKNPWNDSELVAGGATGGIFVRDDAQTDKWGLVDAVASGQVLTSAGTSTLPAWSASPSVTSLSATFVSYGTNPASQGGVRLANTSYVYARNGANSGDVLALGVDSSNRVFLGDSAAGEVYPGSGDTTGALGSSARRWSSCFLSTAVVVGTNPASAGAVRLAATGGINRRNNANGADLAVVAQVTADEIAVGDAGGNTRVRSVMAAPTSLANGDWWLESNTGAVTGASGALMSRLNGATVLVAPSLRAKGRATAQTGANASVSTFTVGAADASFEVSANVLVTTATNHNFTVTCAYTDEGNTARTLTLTFGLVAGGVATTAVANANGAVPYHGVPLHIRCKASTAITIATTGTFTTVTYNVEGVIRQLT